MNDKFEILLTYLYVMPTILQYCIMKIKNTDLKKTLYWHDEYELSNGKKEEIFEKCRLYELQIDVFHLSFKRANDLWKSNIFGKKTFSIYKQSILDVHNNNVKAEKLNVNIAFEDLQSEDQLNKIEYMLNKYSSACLYFKIQKQKNKNETHFLKNGYLAYEKRTRENVVKRESTI